MNYEVSSVTREVDKRFKSNELFSRYNMIGGLSGSYLHFFPFFILGVSAPFMPDI
jgi:hypothetical protein